MSDPTDKHAVPQQRRRVVAVTGGKGGVGKSLIAANLATWWAATGRRTLALDGDFGMADLNLLFGVAPQKTLADVLKGVPIEEVLVEAHGVTLVSALNGSYKLANLDQRSREMILRAVDTLAERYDKLVIDTAAGIGETVIALAGAATEVVVVATPEPLSIADAYACIKVLATRQGVARVLLVPNSVRSTADSDTVVQTLTTLADRFLGVKVARLPSVPWDPAVSDASAAGVPVVVYKPDAPASRAIKRVASTLEALAHTDEQPASSRLWLGREINAAGGKG